MFNRKPKLDQADQRKVALANLTQLEEALGKIYVTKQGLILESALVEKISGNVEATTQPVTVEELALEFGVSHDAVRASISQTPFYCEQSTMYGPKALDKIANAVPSVPKLSIDFCKEENVTFKLLQQLRTSVALVGDYVLQQAALKQHRQHLDELFSAKEPVEIPNSPILDEIVSQIQYDGRFDRATRIFTPQSYRNSQRDIAAEKVKAEGAVLAEEIPFNSKKFAKRYEFSLVSNYIVSQKFIEDQVDAAKRQLDAEGIFDPSTLYIPVPLDIKAQEVGGVYLRSSFETSLKSQLLTSAAKQGKEAAGQVTDVDSSSNPRKIANQLKPPTTSEILTELASDKLPPKVAKVLAQKFTVDVRNSYLDAATAIIESKVKLAQDAVTARISAYLQGVLSCKDALRDSLFEEWQAYANENDPSTGFISTISQAEDHFPPDSTTLEETVVQMNTPNITKLSKLEKAKDGATILHLAVVIYHSHLLGNKAILKCRGKQIPKVLKQFEFPPSFTQLKSDVTKKMDPSDSIKAVKEIISNI